MLLVQIRSCSGFLKPCFARSDTIFRRFNSSITIDQSNVAQFFNNISHKLSTPFLSRATDFSKIKLPAKPKTWEFKPGWYRYETGKKPEQVSHPLEDSICFDIEILYKIAPYPTMATCASEKAWYGWVSPYLTGEKETPTDLIPLNPNNESKIIVGHNVNFDRSKVLDDYITNKNSNSCYIDTIALFHARYVRPSYKRTTELIKASEPFFEGNESKSYIQNFIQIDYRLHTLYQKEFGKSLPKEMRSLFDSTSKHIIVDQFQNCMSYCADDVISTHDLFVNFWNKYTDELHHSMEFFALKEKANNKVILNIAQWDKFDKDCVIKIEEATKKYKDDLKEIVSQEVKRATYATQTASEFIGLKWKGQFPMLYDKQRGEILMRVSDETTTRIGDDRISNAFSKSYVPLWETGAFSVDPQYQHIVDNFLSTTFWNFSKKLSEYTYFPTPEDPKNMVTVMPAIKVSANSSGQPIDPLWMSSPGKNIIGGDFRDQIVAPPGYCYVKLGVDENTLFTIIKKSKSSKLVSPFLLRDAVHRLRLQQLNHIIVAAHYLFKEAGIQDFQIASTFSNEARYLVKKEDEKRAKNVLKVVDKLVKLAMKAELPAFKKTVKGVTEDEVKFFSSPELKTTPSSQLFGQFSDLLSGQNQAIQDLKTSRSRAYSFQR